jgi:hypothetical protein
MLLQFWEEIEIRWSCVWVVWWVVQDCETKVVDLWSYTCTDGRPCIVVMEDNLLHVRTKSSNMYL